MTKRIIARLDIKGPSLVKGIHLEGLRVLGQPAQFAEHYYHQGADEILYMDAVASLYNRNSLLDVVQRTSEQILIPLCVGGGLRGIDDIRKVLLAGADKVSLNTAAIARPDLITDAANAFGASTIVVTIEAIRQPDGSHRCFTDCGREATGLEAVAWAQQAEALGAGEITVTSVDREGTGKGFDLELLRKVSDAVSIPVIGHGGAGSATDVALAFETGHADAVALASLLHYNAIRTLPLDAGLNQDNSTDYLRNRRNQGNSRIKDVALPALKRFLSDRGLPMRQVNDLAASERAAKNAP